MTDQTHELTIERHPRHATIRVGVCTCQGFYVKGPEDIIHDFHAVHRMHPDATLRGTASR